MRLFQNSVIRQDHNFGTASLDLKKKRDRTFFGFALFIGAFDRI
jgi:hypothetical protein